MGRHSETSQTPAQQQNWQPKGKQVFITVILVCSSRSGFVSDVVEKTSTRRRSRVACVVVGKITTRRREGVGVVVEKNEESRRTFNKNSCDLLTAIMHTEILVAPCIFLTKSESVRD